MYETQPLPTIILHATIITVLCVHVCVCVSSQYNTPLSFFLLLSSPSSALLHTVVRQPVVHPKYRRTDYFLAEGSMLLRGRRLHHHHQSSSAETTTNCCEYINNSTTREETKNKKTGKQLKKSKKKRKIYM